MKFHRVSLPFFAGLLLFTSGCETGGTYEVYSDSYQGYYGYGDPWYYGGYYDDDIIALPPVDRPGYAPARPSHPIARPPMAAPRPMPMPRGSSRR